MTKHEGFTPGPWTNIPDSWPPNIVAKRAFIAECLISTTQDARGLKRTNNEEVEANARLIADAPALLAERDRAIDLLKRALRNLPGVNEFPNPDKTLIAEIRAALADSKG